MSTGFLEIYGSDINLNFPSLSAQYLFTSLSVEVDIQKNDDDDDDEEQEDDNEDDEDEEMAVDDESEESDEEDDDEEEVDEEFRRSVKTALGPAAVDSDKEDEVTVLYSLFYVLSNVLISLIWSR